MITLGPLTVGLLEKPRDNRIKINPEQERYYLELAKDIVGYFDSVNRTQFHSNRHYILSTIFLTS